jgi:hypothetical protein
MWIGNPNIYASDNSGQNCMSTLPTLSSPTHK